MSFVVNCRPKKVLKFFLLFSAHFSIMETMIGKNIKRLRREKGISQDKLSKLADLSLNTISKIELEENPNPTIETVQKIAGALGVSVEKILEK